MYAIVDIAGQQVRVEKGKTVKVPYLSQEVGESIVFDRVLLLDDEKNVKIGQPVLDGIKISAKIIEHGREDKVLIFKKKRRKGYQKKQGHRQPFTKIQIEKIG